MRYETNREGKAGRQDAVNGVREEWLWLVQGYYGWRARRESEEAKGTATYGSEGGRVRLR